MVNGIAVQKTGSRTSTCLVEEHNSHPLYYIITFILTKTKPNPDRNPNSDPDPDPNPRRKHCISSMAYDPRYLA